MSHDAVEHRVPQNAGASAEKTWQSGYGTMTRSPSLLLTYQIMQSSGKARELEDVTIKGKEALAEGESYGGGSVTSISKLDQLGQVRKMIEGSRWKAQENCDGVYDLN